MTLTRGLSRAVRNRRRNLAGIGEADRSTEGSGRVALVTGASSGIGWCLAEVLAAKGYDIVAVARREPLLEDLRLRLESQWGVKVHCIPIDLGDPSGPAALHREVDDRGLSVDFLVNNAGYAFFAPYDAMDWAEGLRYVQVLALTTAELSRHFLPHMTAQGWGRILNIASVAGVLPGTPDMALYSSSKAFVIKLSEGLAAELEPRGVRCTVAVVGATDTPVFDDSVTPEWLGSLGVQLSMMRPETVARKAYAATMQGRRVVVPGVHNKAWAVAAAHAPRAIRYKLAEISTRIHP